MPSGERHRRGVAIHEAGHAVMCRLLGVRIKSVTVAWSGTTHGALIYVGKPRAEDFLLILLAGEAAVARAHAQGWFAGVEEQTARGGDDKEPHDVFVTSDDENVAAVLEQLHPDDGDAREASLRAARDQVDAAVERHWEAIVAVAQALLHETSLKGRRVRRVIEAAS